MKPMANATNGAADPGGWAKDEGLHFRGLPPHPIFQSIAAGLDDIVRVALRVEFCAGT